VTSDPVELIIAEALRDASIGFTTPDERHDPTGLDFRLENGVEIECKRFHSARITGQLAQAPDVIVVQGMGAAKFLARLIRGGSGK